MVIQLVTKSGLHVSLTLVLGHINLCKKITWVGLNNYFLSTRQFSEEKQTTDDLNYMLEIGLRSV